MYIYIYTYTYLFIYLFRYSFIFIYIFIYLCIFIFIYFYIYIFIYLVVVYLVVVYLVVVECLDSQVGGMIRLDGRADAAVYASWLTFAGASVRAHACRRALQQLEVNSHESKKRNVICICVIYTVCIQYVFKSHTIKQ